MDERPPPSIHVTSVIGVNDLLSNERPGLLMWDEFQELCHRLTGEQPRAADYPLDAELHLSLRVPAELHEEVE